MKREGQHRRRRTAWLSFRALLLFLSLSLFLLWLENFPSLPKNKSCPYLGKFAANLPPPLQRATRERQRERQQERARARVYCKSALAQPAAAAAFNGKERDRDELSTHTHTYSYIHTYVHIWQLACNTVIISGIVLFAFCCFCAAVVVVSFFAFALYTLFMFYALFQTHAHIHTKWFSLFMLRQMQHEITKAKVEREGKSNVARPN